MKNNILKHLKRAISGITALIMVAGAVSVPVMAEEAKAATVMWETDFEDYESGTFYGSSTKWVNRYSGNTRPYTDEDGNKWMKIINGQSKWSGYTITLADDATEGIKTGKVIFSFDFFRGKSSTSATGDYTFNNYFVYNTTTEKTARIMSVNAETNTMHIGSNLNSNGYSLEENVPVRVDILIDLDEDVFKLAINGEIHSTLAYDVSGELLSVMFRMSDGSAMDNLKISYAPESFDVQADEISFSEDELILDFNQSLSKDFDPSEVVIKNLYTGNDAQITDSYFKTDNELVLITDGFELFDEHEIIFPESLKGSFGDEFKGKNPIISKIDESGDFALTNVSFKDYDEKEFLLTDSISPVTKNMNLSFTDEVDVDSLAEAISFVSKETGEKAEIPVTFATEENKAIINFEGAFYENEEYILKIDGVLSTGGDELLKTYSIPFSVGAGKTTITEYGFYKDDVLVSAEEITAGDEISIKFKAVKPTREAADIYLSYGVYEDSLMTDFGIEKIAFAENVTVAESELNLIVPESDGFTLKSFLWQKAGGFPLTTEIELTK